MKIDKQQNNCDNLTSYSLWTMRRRVITGVLSTFLLPDFLFDLFDTGLFIRVYDPGILDGFVLFIGDIIRLWDFSENSLCPGVLTIIDILRPIKYLQRF